MVALFPVRFICFSAILIVLVSSLSACLDSIMNDRFFVFQPKGWIATMHTMHW